MSVSGNPMGHSRNGSANIPGALRVFHKLDVIIFTNSESQVSSLKPDGIEIRRPGALKFMQKC